jgi:hypothetical protein
MNDELFPWSIKQVKGALKASIHDHGEITKNTAASAAKRIVNQLYGATAPTQVAARLEAAHKRELQLLGRIQQLEEALRALYKAVGHMDFSYEMGEGDKVEAVAKARAALSSSTREAPEKEEE